MQQNYQENLKPFLRSLQKTKIDSFYFFALPPLFSIIIILLQRQLLSYLTNLIEPTLSNIAIVVSAKNTTCIYIIKLFTNVSASTSCNSMQLEAVENGNSQINEMKLF